MTVKTPPELLDDRDLRHIRRYLKVTSGEIADLAGKDPSAVTHWRKGKKGFPEPVVGGRSPLFRYDEAHDWLKEHNKLAHEPDPAWLWRKSVQALHESTGVADRSRLRGYVTTMVVVVPDFTNDLDDFVELRETEGFDRWRDETGRDLDTETEKFLGQHINEVKPHGETLKCAARALRYALRKQCAEWELLDCALGALDALSPVQTTTSLPVADLITELIGNLAGQAWTVADLACGEATLITGLLKRDLPSDARFVGVEKDRDTAAIARIRLMLRSSSTTADIQVGDSLAEATTAGLFDAVVIDPPTKKTKAWLDLARKSLATNQTSRAFVLLPKSALVADGPCASLTRERRLEAVVYLPNRLKKDSRGLALCVITSESVRCEETLLIDLADLKVKNPYSGPLTQLSDPIRDVLPINDVSAAVSHWQTTRTINRDLLRGRQESITADNAIKRGLGSHSRLLPDDSHANSDRHGTAQRSLLEGANLVGADLKGKNLEGADLEGANLKGANLEQANLVGANLEGANLEQANLVGADLVGADLKGKNLVWAHLEGANLERADLRGASLEGAYLERADLHWADLEGANLKGADLEGANLEGANLKGAKLKGANLGGADLEGANLERADLRGAEADEQTTWPKGFDPQAAEVIFED